MISTNPHRLVRGAACALMAAGLALGGAAHAAPSQKSLKKAFTAKLAGTWGDVRYDGAAPGLPDGWALFGCGEQPAFVIAGSDRAGFTVKAHNMELGPVEAPLTFGAFDSKTSGRVVLPGVSWEQRLTIKNKDLMILDSVDAKPEEPSAQARYLQRCK